MKAYTATWEERCYSDGIPDELPNKLLFSGRAPSYKAIAICILSNDLYLKKLGLSIPSTKKGREIERQLKDSLKKTKQIEMF